MLSIISSQPCFFTSIKWRNVVGVYHTHSLQKLLQLKQFCFWENIQHMMMGARWEARYKKKAFLISKQFLGGVGGSKMPFYNIKGKVTCKAQGRNIFHRYVTSFLIYTIYSLYCIWEEDLTYDVKDWLRANCSCNF